LIQDPSLAPEFYGLRIGVIILFWMLELGSFVSFRVVREGFLGRGHLFISWLGVIHVVVNLSVQYFLHYDLNFRFF
jgi:hypothetical protein